MKVICTNNLDIPNLTKGKVYTIKKLYTDRVSLVDSLAIHTYSLKRFRFEDGKCLKEYTKGLDSKESTLYISTLYIDDRFKFNFGKKLYLYCHSDCSFGETGDILVTQSFDKVQKWVLKLLKNNDKYVSTTVDKIQKFCYTITKDKYDLLFRKQKIKKLYNRYTEDYNIFEQISQCTDLIHLKELYKCVGKGSDITKKMKTDMMNMSVEELKKQISEDNIDEMRRSIQKRILELSINNDKELYSEIENLIIRYTIDGEKTAGYLTKQIMKLIKNQNEKNRS